MNLQNELEALQEQIKDTDNEVFTEDAPKLKAALERAINDINLRRNFTPTDDEPYEKKYRINVIFGAVDYLSRMGNGSLASFNENGVRGTYTDVPEWLRPVIPRLGVL